MGVYIQTIKLINLLVPLMGQGNHRTVDEIRQQSARLREQFVKMGPTFIKFGQILSLRYDLLHPVTCEELQVLLDHQDVAMAFDEVMPFLKSELRSNFSKIASVSRDPIAVASLAQVHIATLKEGNQKVAIKIQKKDIQKRIEKDLKAINVVLGLMMLTPIGRRISVKDLFSEFATWTVKELDFTLEATNIEAFTESLKDEVFIVVPRVFRSLTTNRVLTTEFIEGASAKELMEAFSTSDSDDVLVRGRTFSKSKVVKMFDKAVFKQVFVKGIIHGDPHPSNIILIDNDHVAFIDFGIMMQLNEYQKALMNKVIYDISTGKREDVVKALIVLDQEPGAMPEDKILKQLDPFFNKAESSIAEEYGPTRFMMDMLYQCGKVGIQIPKFWVLISKVIVTYDGMLQRIKPQSSLMRELVPLFEAEEGKNLFDLTKLTQNLFKTPKLFESVLELVTALPTESLDLLKEVKLNGIKINYTNKPEDKKGKWLTRATLLMFLIFASLGGFLVTFVVAGPQSPSSLIMLGLVVIIMCVSLINLFKD